MDRAGDADQGEAGAPCVAELEDRVFLDFRRSQDVVVPAAASDQQRASMLADAKRVASLRPRWRGALRP